MVHSIPRSRAPSSGGRKAGLTLLELLVSMMVLTMATGGIVVAMLQSRALARQNRERTTATLAAQDVLERMHGLSFSELFARYNSTTADDPAGAVPSPGAAFAVPSLVPWPDDPDGACGEVLIGTSAGEVREDLVDPALGLPRDLNLDGGVDALDHSDDYRILPLRIRVRWTGVSGDQEVVITHLYSELSG
jgi:type II secretory pathway pseudopilin PulG